MVNRLQSRQSTGSGCLTSKMRSQNPRRVGWQGKRNARAGVEGAERRRDPTPCKVGHRRRPNVGKSTLGTLWLAMNGLSRPTTGHNADAISIEWMNDLPIKLIDTAGAT